jgi:hypothetical protein
MRNKDRKIEEQICCHCRSNKIGKPNRKVITHMAIKNRSLDKDFNVFCHQ